MKFEQKCAVCNKNKITWKTNIEANVFTLYSIFVKKVKKNGWTVLTIEDGSLMFNCPFCSRRVIKELKKRLNE